MAETMTMKRCPQCGETKPLEEFYKSRTKKDGRQGRCKVCDKAASGAWQAANPERHKANWAAWCATNPERKKATLAAWCRKNKDRVKATSAVWREKNQDLMKALGAAWRTSNPERVTEYSRRRHLRRMAAANAIQAHRETLSPADDRTLRRSIYNVMMDGVPFLFESYKLNPSDIASLGWVLSWWREDILNSTELEDERQRVLARMG